MVNVNIEAKKKSRFNESGFFQEFSKNKELFIMIMLPALFIFINNYVPMFGIIIAFKEFNYEGGFLNSPWCWFDNFEFLFKSENAWIITRNTVGYNLIFILVGLCLASTIAIILNELRSRFLSKFFQSVIFLPYFLSWVVVAYLVYSVLAPNGFYNKALVQLLHLGPKDWYISPEVWPYIIPIVYTWKMIGYSIVIYLAGITGIDQEYYEAASLDGATKFQQIKSITIPFLTPLMIITTIMAIGNIFRADFGLFFQVPMEQGLLATTTDVLDTYIYKALIQSSDLGMSSAAGFYQSVVGFVLVLAANWIVGKISEENKIF